ncbi:MAG: formate dehydrogenase accessory protein FdhE [Candidatus Korobacteraceae bacterium]
MMAASDAARRQPDWTKRIRRAGELAERFPHAAEVLTFYRQVLELQQTISAAIASACPASPPGLTFREQLKASVVLPHLPALLSLMEKHGPSTLAKQAREIGRGSADQQIDVIERELTAPGSESFFARVLLQPYAEQLTSTHPPQPPGSAGSTCPLCGGRPQVAVLRPEGDGGKRFLLCSFCLTEWEFRRILCPVCGEEDYAKLPRYSAEDLIAVRVEACDTCHYYLKSVDMTIDGLAVPMVDEVATASLDLWASGHGYKKAELNIMGF